MNKKNFNLKRQNFFSRIKYKGRYLFIVFLFLALSSLVIASIYQTLTQTDFNLGTYNNTLYNSSVGSGAVQINLSYNNGTYTSQIYNTGSNVTLNNLSWTYQRIQCPQNMSYINKLNGFCIDQYEASMPSANSTAMGNSTDVPNRNNPGTMKAISQPRAVPWVGISANSARTACANAGKHLCTSEEWLSAANINGQMYYLPSGAATASSIPSGASDSAACNTYTAANCAGMSMNSSYVIGTGGDACNTGNKTSCVSAEGVYDMVGNVWEWVNESVDTIKPSTCNSVAAGWCYLNSTGVFSTSTTATTKYGSDGVYFLANSSSSTRAVFRGGGWAHRADAGPFCAFLGNGPADATNTVGFRCCSS